MALVSASCSRPTIPTADNTGIKGQVTNASGPVEDAVVRIKATSIETRTDRDGRFSLSSKSMDLTDSVTVTASKEGYFIASSSGQSGDYSIQLHSLPQVDNEKYEWVDPTPSSTESDNCGNCHAQIHDEWKLGAHANSATGRRFLNLYEGTDWSRERKVGWNLSNDHPEGIGVCSSCHAPASDLDQLAIGDIRDISPVAKHGVHCDFCHKVEGVSLENVGITHGRFGMKLLRPEHDQLFFGPLDDVDRGEDAHSPLMSKSEFCATCHEGIVFGVPVYTTYSEWLESPARRAGKQCQSCHMKPSGKMTNIAPEAGGVERDPQTLASHELFPGGKEAMLKRSVTVQVEQRANATENSIHVAISAANVGHRVPTGFIDRHLILVVQAFAPENEKLRVSGPALSQVAGSFSGEAGALFGQVLIGENGESPIPFWQPVIEHLDTRLIPGKTQELVFKASKRAARVHVRLIYRKFWESVAKEKGWPANELLVYDQWHEIANREP